MIESLYIVIFSMLIGFLAGLIVSHFIDQQIEKDNYIEKRLNDLEKMWKK